MDRDEFARAPRLARRAAESIRGALRGEPFDPIFVARQLDRFFDRAGGSPSFGPLFNILADAQREPLFAFTVPSTLANASSRLQANASGMLDLDLALSAHRYATVGGKEAHELACTVMRRIIDREVIFARGGVIQSLGAEGTHAARPMIIEMLSPIVHEAGRLLVANPSRKRLGLAATLNGTLAVDDDLLGS